MTHAMKLNTLIAPPEAVYLGFAAACRPSRVESHRLSNDGAVAIER